MKLIRTLMLASLFSVACSGGRGTQAPHDPVLRPEVFFEGQTIGRGVLVFRDGTVDRRFEVSSCGIKSGSGDVDIEQTIRFDDGEVRTRRWTLEQTSAHEYRGTLSGASGPVRATAKDGVLSISYRMSGTAFARMKQSVYLQPGGQAAINTGTVRVLGVVVRRLHEVIEITGRGECQTEEAFGPVGVTAASGRG